MKVSVIIPVYNEESTISKCLESLTKQTKKLLEIIVVDDGSTDDSLRIVENLKSQISNLKLLVQNHKGPGAARNLGVKQANGEIIVFVDSDMTFAPDFIKRLVEPIEKGVTKGTFTKEEYISNWDNVWARCWNYDQGIVQNRRIPLDYPETAPVFRAILKSEFDRVDGFIEGIGWTDDWSLSRKLGYSSTTTHARCYHANPATPAEVFHQAKWIGKNEFFAKNSLQVIIRLMLFSFPMSFLIGIEKSLRFGEPMFMLFKLIHDGGISLGLLHSLLRRSKNK